MSIAALNSPGDPGYQTKIGSLGGRDLLTQIVSRDQYVTGVGQSPEFYKSGLLQETFPFIAVPISVFQMKAQFIRSQFWGD